MGVKHKLGVVGKGILYSLSPKIHHHFAKDAGLDISYEVFDIDSQPIDFIEEFFELGGKGLNITKPFKEVVASRFSDNLESANCLSSKPIKAYTTDGEGLINDLISKKIDFKGKNIMIFGLGGAGVAVANSLDRFSNVLLFNRTQTKIESMVKNNPSFSKYDGEKIDILISCAQGLDVNAVNFFDSVNLAIDACIYDINYRNETNLVFQELGRVKPKNFFTGEGMLVEQAALSFKIWFNNAPKTTYIKDLINNERL